ncbi:response regulator transcription factor [Methylopila sp. M107]|uniref:response regulator n=1 Tax=Methylopila sp. M107 TaxID=1101190 RepID=UPI00038075CE|nr:response regulator transcription factor [Methylopila sp. M107]
MSDFEGVAVARRFLIVDDHPLFREALKSALYASFIEARIDETGSIQDARDALASARDVDLILLDLTLDRFDDFAGLIRLRKEFPFVPVLIVSGHEEPRLVHEALCLGACGFVPKAYGRAALAEAVREVLNGAIFVPATAQPQKSSAARQRPAVSFADRLASLTPAQLRVLERLRRGMLNREIARELDVGESTVKAHVSEIIRKLGVVSRTQIVIETARHEAAGAQSPC